MRVSTRNRSEEKDHSSSQKVAISFFFFACIYFALAFGLHGKNPETSSKPTENPLVSDTPPQLLSETGAAVPKIESPEHSNTISEENKLKGTPDEYHVNDNDMFKTLKQRPDSIPWRKQAVLESLAKNRTIDFQLFLQRQNKYIVEIRSHLMGQRCLDVQEGNKPSFNWENVPGVQVWDCSFEHNQRFIFYDDNSIRSLANDQYCMDTTEQGVPDRPIIFTKCDSHTPKPRQWYIHYNSNTVRTYPPGATPPNFSRPLPQNLTSFHHKSLPLCLVVEADTNGALAFVTGCSGSKYAASALFWDIV